MSKLCKKGLHHFDGRRCSKCLNEKRRLKYVDVKDVICAKKRLYYENNKGNILEQKKHYYEINKEEIADKVKKDPSKRNARGAKYRACKLNATPKWLTEEHFEQIKSLYKEAKRLESMDNVVRHVDHIIPLQGENVCGLHVPWNLQILSAQENLSKRNKLCLMS